MSPLPARMRNRWSSRNEPAPDRGTIYWHLLMHTYPQACAAATEAQQILASFPGLHMTPRQWLHITTLVAGSTDQITPRHTSIMVSEAQRLLRDVAPIPVTLGKILYHPEAIMLSVQPVEALRPIVHAAQSATRKAVGHAGVIDEPFPSWTPHMTVAYSTTDQSVEPIFSALGKSVRERQILIESLTLVIQWGPERLWDWEPVGTVSLRAPGQATQANHEA
jgi:2'-5' RNA ligase